ncbi:MAG: (2Fe-2S)-binding protein [Pyrinomonadaceae bacterium]|nr:(2Fe-2S)-binding protein [Pyrinomonadaceae bacterium]
MSSRCLPKPAADAATGLSANFSCGCFAEFGVAERPEGLVPGVRTDGCGYAAATLAILSDEVAGKATADLGGLSDEVLFKAVERRFGKIAAERNDCLRTCFEAVHLAFSELRERRLSAPEADTPLICTCFGVTEYDVDRAIADGHTDAESIMDATRAGSGCGSCRMLITEIAEASVPTKLIT